MEGHGERCAVTPTGAWRMAWWSAGCWATRQCLQLMSSMEKAMVLCGCPTWPAMGMGQASVNACTLAGERPLAATLRMQEYPVAVSAVSLLGNKSCISHQFVCKLRIAIERWQ